MSYYEKYLKYKNKYIKYKNKYINLGEIVENDKQPIYKEIMYDNGDKYIGSVIDGNVPIKSGEGIYTYINGNRYEGEFKNNMFNGRGKLFLPTLYIEGNFHNNIIVGNCKIIFDNNDVYEGEYINDKITGKGSMIYSNGNQYTGEFIDDEFNGIGKFTVLDKFEYEGEFKNGEIHGTGKISYKSGKTYDGMFKKNKKDGLGKMTYPNKDIYEGLFKDDKIKEGIFTFNNGNVYEGNFENGKFNGKGKFTVLGKYVYKGEFKDNIMHGKGKLIYNSGDIYKGNFINGIKNGVGIYKYKDETIIEDMFSNGNINISIEDPKEFNTTLKEYEIVLYINSHGCDIPNAVIKIPPDFNIEPIYVGAVGYNCTSLGKEDNTDLYYTRLLFKEHELDNAIQAFQSYKGRLPKYGVPNYNHEYQFGLDKINLNNAYDGIFVIKNNIGLPNYINLFDWTNEKESYINKNPLLRKLSNFITSKLSPDNITKLTDLIKAFNKWIKEQPIKNKKLKVIFLDVSCRNPCFKE